MKLISLLFLLGLISCGQNATTGMQDHLDQSDEVEQLQDQIDDLKQNQDLIETQIAELNAAIMEIRTQNRVVDYIDPCGDNVGQFDEILLVMSDGSIVAYFETGGNRFLSILPENGRFTTTDSQRCSFSMVNGEYQE